MKKGMLLLIALVASMTSYTVAYDVTNTIDSTATYIDVRSINAKERLHADIKGAIWVDPHSLMDINDFLKSADKDKKYIVFCACPHDEYSTAFAELMDREGFTSVIVLKDGWDVLSRNHLSIRRDFL